MKLGQIISQSNLHWLDLDSCWWQMMTTCLRLSDSETLQVATWLPQLQQSACASTLRWRPKSAHCAPEDLKFSQPYWFCSTVRCACLISPSDVKWWTIKNGGQDSQDPGQNPRRRNDSMCQTNPVVGHGLNKANKQDANKIKSNQERQSSKL